MEDSGGTNSAPASHSETNIQEQGVDEPDMVKTNGTHVFVIRDTELVVVQSWPAEEAIVVGRLQLAETATSMFLHGNRVVVFTESWDARGGVLSDGGSQITMRIIDVSDPSAPTTERTITADGSLVSARMIDGQMYATVSRSHDIPNALWDAAWNATPSNWLWSHLDDMSDSDMTPWRNHIRTKLRKKVKAAYAKVGGADLLPTIEDSASDSDTALDCTDVYHGSEKTMPDMLSVLSVDLNEETEDTAVSATGIMASGTIAYASLDNLYVSQESFQWWDGFSEVDRTTRIHRFSLNGNDTAYEGTGVVHGWLHNQFSMSEYNGHLRVATTDNDWWWGTQSQDNRNGNNVYVLDIEDPQMQTVGAVEGLAPGEQIYAARFLGEKGYLVTFVQIDPLFTLDLSDPTAPIVEGELKIPGYSAYLHPIEDGHLLGVGMDGDDNGWLTGVSISLFDVTDASEPIQVDRLTVDSDWSDSESLWDHHAITVHEGMLTVPVYAMSETDWDTTSSLMVVDVDPAGLSQITRIDHDDIVHGTQMRRGLFIDNYLLSISNHGMKVHDMNQPSIDVRSVSFLTD